MPKTRVEDRDSSHEIDKAPGKCVLTNVAAPSPQIGRNAVRRKTLGQARGEFTAAIRSDPLTLALRAPQ